uniref:Uncharacterized protein n=1 Tax=Anguilla anguilla TaxID=7936 RepID=A0A0E9UQN6_ANGAN
MREALLQSTHSSPCVP